MHKLQREIVILKVNLHKVSYDLKCSWGILICSTVTSKTEIKTVETHLQSS